MTEKILTQEYIKELFNYDEESGLFAYRDSNTEAGWVSRENHTSYRLVQIRQRTYKVHRIIWFYVFGLWPNNQIDHINNDGLDNRLDNLRNATASENSLNRRKYKNGEISGISWDKKRSKWRVRINKNDCRKHLGYIEDFFEACCLLKSYALNK